MLKKELQYILLTVFCLSLVFLSSCKFFVEKSEENVDYKAVERYNSDVKTNNKWDEFLPEQVLSIVNGNKDDAEIAEVTYTYIPSKLIWNNNTEKLDNVLRIDVTTANQKADFTLLSILDSDNHVIYTTKLKKTAKIGFVPVLGEENNQLVIEEDIAGNSATETMVRIYDYNSDEKTMALIFEECIENRISSLPNYSCVNTMYYKKIPSQDSLNIILQVNKYSDKESSDQHLKKTYNIEFQYDGNSFIALKPYEPYRIKTSDLADFDILKENKDVISWEETN